jgi:hypothetical protein
MQRSHESANLDGIPCRYSWLYYVLIESLKQVSGLRQGYGLSKLLAAVEWHRSSPRYAMQVKAITGHTPSFRAVRSIERLISVQLFDRSAPHSQSLFSRYRTDLAEVAFALSNAVSQFAAPASSTENANRFKQGIYQLQFECNVAAPKGFDFLRTYLDVVLRKRTNDGVYVTPVIIQGALAEKAISEGATVRADSGVCEVLKCGTIVLDTQSATLQGRDHKKKARVAKLD